MDGQESIDWDSLKKHIEAYDNGCRARDSIHAKMLDQAYDEGYAHCMADHEEMHANLVIMLSSPAGNA